MNSFKGRQKEHMIEFSLGKLRLVEHGSSLRRPIVTQASGAHSSGFYTQRC